MKYPIKVSTAEVERAKIWCVQQFGLQQFGKSWNCYWGVPGYDKNYFFVFDDKEDALVFALRWSHGN